MCRPRSGSLVFPAPSPRTSQQRSRSGIAARCVMSAFTTFFWSRGRWKPGQEITTCRCVTSNLMIEVLAS